MFHADVDMEKMAVMSIQLRGRMVLQEFLSFSLPFTHIPPSLTAFHSVLNLPSWCTMNFL